MLRLIFVPRKAFKSNINQYRLRNTTSSFEDLNKIEAICGRDEEIWRRMFCSLRKERNLSLYLKSLQYLEKNKAINIKADDRNTFLESCAESKESGMATKYLLENVSKLNRKSFRIVLNSCALNGDSINAMSIIDTVRSVDSSSMKINWDLLIDLVSLIFTRYSIAIISKTQYFRVYPLASLKMLKTLLKQCGHVINCILFCRHIIVY